MLVALAEAHRDHETTTDSLLKRVAQEVHLLWRQQVVNVGADDPGPIDWNPPAKRTGMWRSIARKAMTGLRR